MAKWKKKYTKIKNPNVKFYFLVIMGIGFGVWGGILPPEGVISPSFLVMIAQLFILAAAILGLGIRFNLKDTIFDSKEDGYEDDEDDKKQ